MYERFMLNRLFDGLLARHPIRTVLEVPLYGMTGLTGINSVRFAERGCDLALVDSRKESIEEARRLLDTLPHGGRCTTVHQANLSRLPFADRGFDLVWNFAALWHVKNAEGLLSEMARVSSHLVLVVVANTAQPAYRLRKHLVDKGFFATVDERWTDIGRVNGCLSALGMHRVAQGVVDVPPWPDTCMPIGKIMEKIGLRREGRGRRRDSKRLWRWDIMEHYLGRDRTLKRAIGRLAFLEELPIPWWMKTVWAHHRYSVFSKD